MLFLCCFLSFSLYIVSFKRQRIEFICLRLPYLRAAQRPLRANWNRHMRVTHKCKHKINKLQSIQSILFASVRVRYNLPIAIGYRSRVQQNKSSVFICKPIYEYFLRTTIFGGGTKLCAKYGICARWFRCTRNISVILMHARIFIRRLISEWK